MTRWSRRHCNFQTPITCRSELEGAQAITSQQANANLCAHLAEINGFGSGSLARLLDHLCKQPPKSLTAADGENDNFAPSAVRQGFREDYLSLGAGLR